MKVQKSLQDEIKIATKEKISEFHYYVKEFGYEKAKIMIISSTCLKPVINYINNYNLGG